ncbi:MAG: S41 family peptidase [Verrucomicrobiales bacterium]
MHRLHKKFGRLAVWLMTFSTTGLSPLAQETLPEQPALPRLKEVSERIVEKVPHLSAQDLEHAALQGILTEFQGIVELESTQVVTTDESSNRSSLSRKERLGETLLYLRFHRLQAESSAEILHAIESSALPELKGLILDWRYCQDDAFEAIPPLLALFVSEAVSLPKMGLDVESVTPAPSRVEIPTVVLVNEGTKGSPEVMAALRKQGRHAVLVGRTTAGRAVVRDVVPLSTGQKLYLATGPVMDSQGHPLVKGGCHPDIAVDVSDADQAAWFDDPYWSPTTMKASSAGARLNEAALIQRQADRDSEPASEETESEENREPAQPIRDPILARGVDILKGWSILRPTRATIQP